MDDGPPAFVEANDSDDVQSGQAHLVHPLPVGHPGPDDPLVYVDCQRALKTSQRGALENQPF
jgi:hypothetical protein